MNSGGVVVKPWFAEQEVPGSISEIGYLLPSK